MEKVTSIYLFIYLNACEIQMVRKIWKSKENQSKTLISFLRNEGMESTEDKQWCREDIQAPSQLQGGCPSSRAGREATGKEGRSSQGLSLSPVLCRTLGTSRPVSAALLPLLPPLLLNFQISLWKSCGSVDCVVVLCAKERSKMLPKSQLKSSCLTLVLALPKGT